MVVLAIHVAICVWIIWLGGAERLQNTASTILFFIPGMDRIELKVWAGLSLALIPIYLLAGGT
ncbi:MAG: hypothetical protein AAGE01_05830 [Pseudomonadota bacterium]